MLLNIPYCSENPFFLFKKKLKPKAGEKVWKIVSRYLKKNPPNWKITFIKKGKRPTSHRSTTYPCYVPILGDFAGADRVGLAVANIQFICIFTTELIIFCFVSCRAFKNHYEKL